MTLEADLLACLDVLVNGRVYSDIGPPDVVKPYITYQQVGGDAIKLLGNEMPDKRNARIQVNIWSTTRMEANGLMRQAETLLVTSTVLLAEAQTALTANYEPETKLYGAFQFFSIWS